MFFDDNVLSGFFWRAGFSADPGPRSSIRIEYGQRYGDDFIDANARYAISQRFVFTAAASRSFRTRAQSVTSQFQSTQRGALEFADQLRAGQELNARGVIDAANWYAQGQGYGSAQTNGVSVSDNASATLTGDLGRTEISANGYYGDDDFGFRQVKYFGVGMIFVLVLCVTGYGSVLYRHIDSTFDPTTCEANPLIFGFDPTDPVFNAMTDCANLAANDGVTDTVVGRIGASYRLYENASLFIEGSHSERFADNPALEYGENSILAGITLDF